MIRAFTPTVTLDVFTEWAAFVTVVIALAVRMRPAVNHLPTHGAVGRRFIFDAMRARLARPAVTTAHADKELLAGIGAHLAACAP